MSILETPEFWLIVANLLLVTVTAFYAIQTRRTVIVMREATEAQFLPHLKSSLHLFTTIGIQLLVENVGKGPALGVRVEFGLREFKDSLRFYETPMLASNDNVRLWIPVGKDKEEYSMDFFDGNQSTLDFQAKYLDAFDRPHVVSESIDVTTFVRQFKKTSVSWEPPNYLAEITRVLEKITRVLENVEREVKNLKSG